MEALKDMMKVIRAEAYRCRKMMCSSYTLMDCDDLIQEGVLCFFRIYDLYKDGRDDHIPMPRFFYRSLINTYCNKVIESYKHEQVESKVDEEVFVNKVMNCISVGKVVDLVDICCGMTPEAVEYINLCINPPDELRCNMKHKGNLALIRRVLGLTCSEELTLRREIINSIKGISRKDT
jgi:hypothetical protein